MDADASDDVKTSSLLPTLSTLAIALAGAALLVATPPALAHPRPTATQCGIPLAR